MPLRISVLALPQIACGIAALIVAHSLRGYSPLPVDIYIAFQITAGIGQLIVAYRFSKLSLGAYVVFVGYTAAYLVIISPIFLYYLYGGIFLAQSDLEKAQGCLTEQDNAMISECSNFLVSTRNSLIEYSLLMAVSLLGAAFTTIFFLKFLASKTRPSKYPLSANGS